MRSRSALDRGREKHRGDRALVAEEKASFRAALERTIATAVDGAARLKRG
jgi:hypothetical protein